MFAVLLSPVILSLAGMLACPPDSGVTPAATVAIVKSKRAAPAIAVAVAQDTPAPRACVAGEGAAPDRVVNPPLDRGPTLVWHRSDEDGNGKPVVFIARNLNPPDNADADEEAETEAAQVDAPPPIAAGGPWLGIQFGPVPEALAAHLDTQNAMILLNIAKDSPADEAGLMQYDVVTALDGRPMSPDVNNVMNVIKEFTTGQSLEIKLIRRGKPIAATLTVGTRPEDVSKLEYKYKSPPEVASAQFQTLAPQFFTLKNGRLLVPDDEALKQLQGLVPQLKDHERLGALNVLKGTQKSYAVIRQTDGGETIEIRTEPDGKIKVSRFNKNDDRTSHVYATEDELKKEDPDAFKLYEESRAAGGVTALGGVSGMDRWNDKDFDIRMKQALESYRRALRNAPQAAIDTDRARKQLDEKLHELFESAAHMHNSGASFRTCDDGSIAVVTRDGDDELVQTFRNEETLKRERPDLFQRYDRMRNKEFRSK